MTYGALIFKGMPRRLKLDLHRPLPDHGSIRSCTLTKEGRISRVALQIEVADVHTAYFPQVEETIWSEFSGPFHELKAAKGPIARFAGRSESLYMFVRVI